MSNTGGANFKIKSRTTEGNLLNMISFSVAERLKKFNFQTHIEIEQTRFVVSKSLITYRQYDPHCPL